MKQIASKILAVMKDVDYVHKDGTNTFQRYNYVSEAGIVDKIRTSMIEHGLVCVPSVTSSKTVETSSTAKGAAQWLGVVEIEYTFIDCDSGESIVVRMPGAGIDTGDKGIYKAITGANKYAMLKTFQVPTGDDPEADENVDANNVAPTPLEQTLQFEAKMAETIPPDTIAKFKQEIFGGEPDSKTSVDMLKAYNTTLRAEQRRIKKEQEAV